MQVFVSLNAQGYRPARRAAAEQVMVDANNKVLAAFHSIAKDQFSVNLPDETDNLYLLRSGYSVEY
jgi:hypothetical protein